MQQRREIEEIENDETQEPLEDYKLQLRERLEKLEEGRSVMAEQR